MSVCRSRGRVWPLAALLWLSLGAASAPTQDHGSPRRIHTRIERMHFDFQDLPIRSALQLIASLSGFNVIVGDDVQGRLSLHLDKVSWPEALTAILRAKGLDQLQQGRIIWVAKQKTLADYEQYRAQLERQRSQRMPLLSLYLPISYGDAETIAKLLNLGAGGRGVAGKAEPRRGFLSPRGIAAFDKRSNMLLVSDTAAKLAEIRQLVAALDRPVRQVLIEARIVIANRSFLRELGTRFGLRVSSGDGPGRSTDTPRATTGVTSELPASQPAASFELAILGSHYALDLALQAAQNEGRSRLLSSPQAVVANNQQADIQQGQQIGYVTYHDTRGAKDRGSGTASVSFKNAVLELKVTPSVTADRRIYLKIQLVKDALRRLYTVPGSGQVPLIDHRSMNTTVLIDDAQTVVLGGIQEQEEVTAADKVPGLARIPLLGPLFRRHSRQREQGQLLIFVRPRILPVAAP